MNLTTLIQTAKGQYGLAREATEDGLFTDAVMKDAVNGAHKEFAAVGRCYYGTLSSALVVGQVPYALDATVIEPDVYSFRSRAGAGGEWTVLTFKQKRTLIKDHGAAEGWVNGSPANFFLNPGSTAGNAKLVNAYPPPSTTYIHTTTLAEDLDDSETAVTVTDGTKFAAGQVIQIDSERMYVSSISTNDLTVTRGYQGTTAAIHNTGVTVARPDNLKYEAWVYPADLAEPTDEPVLASHEHWRLIPWICHRMALIELSRGRPGAGELVQGWYALALDVAEELREIYRRGMEEPPRTANVGSSAVEDATLRRMSLLRQRRGGGG